MSSLGEPNNLINSYECKLLTFTLSLSHLTHPKNCDFILTFVIVDFRGLRLEGLTDYVC